MDTVNVGWISVRLRPCIQVLVRIPRCVKNVKDLSGDLGIHPKGHETCLEKCLGTKQAGILVTNASIYIYTVNLG